MDTTFLRKNRAQLLAVGGTGLSLAGIVAFVPQVWWPKCPIFATTGLYCPGCGGLRALHAVIEGDLAAAFAQNALFFVIPVFVALGFWAQRRPDSVASRVVIGVVLGVTVVFTILRNLPGSPLAPF